MGNTFSTSSRATTASSTDSNSELDYPTTPTDTHDHLADIPGGLSRYPHSHSAHAASEERPIPVVHGRKSTTHKSYTQPQDHVHLRDENASLCFRIEELQRQLTRQKADLEARNQRKLSEVDQERNRLNKLINERDIKIKSLERQTTAKETENASLRSRLAESGAVTQQVLAQAKEERDRLNRSIHTKDGIISTMKNREAELQGAHTFLTSEDRCSAADILSLVNALNYEILQVSTISADHMATTVWTREANAIFDKEQTPAYLQAEVFLGATFCRELATRDQDTAIALLQFAFQAALCSFSKHFIDQWAGFSSTALSHGLGHIYGAMKQKESQAVFGRWRALTQQQINQVLARKLADSLVENLTKSMVAVAVVCHVQEPNLPDLLATFLADKLNTLVNYLIQIKNAIAIDFVSGDMHLIVVPTGQSFDGQGMRSVYDAEEGNETTSAVCTTELGLSLVKKLTKEGGSREERSILNAPEVLLLSSLQDIVQPQS